MQAPNFCCTILEAVIKNEVEQEILKNQQKQVIQIWRSFIFWWIFG